MPTPREIARQAKTDGVDLFQLREAVDAEITPHWTAAGTARWRSVDAYIARSGNLLAEAHITGGQATIHVYRYDPAAAAALPFGRPVLTGGPLDDCVGVQTLPVEPAPADDAAAWARLAAVLAAA